MLPMPSGRFELNLEIELRSFENLQRGEPIGNLPRGLPGVGRRRDAHHRRADLRDEDQLQQAPVAAAAAVARCGR